MKKLLIVLLIGASAGIVDIIPMIMQKLCLYSITSAFIHWLVLSILINYLQLGLKGWLKGLVVGELATLSIVVLVAKYTPGAVPPILIMTAILGSLVGWAGEKLLEYT